MKKLKRVLSLTLALIITLSFSQLFFVGARNVENYYFEDSIIKEKNIKMFPGEKKIIGDDEDYLDYFDEKPDIVYSEFDYGIDEVVSSNPSVLKVEKISGGWSIKAISAGTVTVTLYDDNSYYSWDDDDDLYFPDDDFYYDEFEEKMDYDGCYDRFTVTVNKIPSNKISATDIATQNYTGTAIKPAVKLTYKKTELKAGKDYTVEYKNNVKIGTATLTVKLIGNYTGTITKKFKIVPSISKTAAFVYYGSQYQLTVKSSERVSWSSSDTKIAKVNSKGLVTPVKAGKATITAVTGGKKLNCVVTVKPRSLSAADKKVYLGQSFNLKYNGGSGEIKWASSNAKVAKVNKNGVVTAVGIGKATVTAVRNNVAVKCSVEVVSPKLNYTTMNLYIGYKKALVLKGATGKTTWKSANESIAIVSQKGNVKGLRKGTTVIYAVNNGRTYKCTVNVKSLPPITINSVDWDINSADGVEPIIEITNNTKKDIKYIDFTMYFYNRVGDLTYCEIWNQCYRNLWVEGPLYAKSKDKFYWDPIFYNSNVSAVRIKNVVVEYMDGTKQKVPYNTLWYDQYYYYK
ncbi:MAG: Ig-like domain-containing protein [Clostridia bacterium]|nr:Ig-like domain-containing protein [Clostridia bacterium]